MCPCLRPVSWFRLVALGASILALGCGGFTPPAPGAAPVVPPSRYGTLNVSLAGDGDAPEFTRMTVLLSGMAMEVGGVWTAVPLDAPQPSTEGTATSAFQSLDLQKLTSANPAVLATGVAWPEGLNTRLRLLLAPGGSVTTAADGQDRDLRTAPVLEAPMGLPGGFSVAAGTVTNLMILVDRVHAALPDPAQAATFAFQPLAVRGYDQAATGSIQGRVTAPAEAPGASPVPLEGATVTAQLVEPWSADGSGVVFRTAVTDGSGRFTLDLLPLGRTWCGVSLPAIGGQSYGAGTGPGVSLGFPPFNLGTSDMTVAPAAATGAVSGSLEGSPPPGEIDVVDLVETFMAGAEPFTVTLQSALVAGGQFTFPAVPPGTYAAVLNRFTYVGGTGMTHQRTTTDPFAVQGGDTLALRF